MGRSPGNTRIIAQTAGGALVAPTATVLYRAAKSSSMYKGAAQSAGFDKKAALARLAPAHSALVRQKALAAKGLSAKAGDVKKLEAGLKGQGTKSFGSLKKQLVPAKQLAGKEKSALKALARGQQKSSLKALSPTRSALVRQKAMAEKGLAAKLGDLKQLEGAVKGQKAKSLGSLKKQLVPVKQLAGQQKSALKTLAKSKEKATLKALSPARSALVRQTSLMGGDLSHLRSEVGKDMSTAKQVAGRSGLARSAKKLGGAAGRAEQEAKQSKVGRLYTGSNEGST